VHDVSGESLNRTWKWHCLSPALLASTQIKHPGSSAACTSMPILLLSLCCAGCPHLEPNCFLSALIGELTTLPVAMRMYRCTYSGSTWGAVRTDQHSQHHRVTHSDSGH
jgi:hypothetical protein